MSERYPGGYITKNAPQPTGGESGVADGVWTLEQALEYKQAGNWPIPIQPVYVEDVFSTYLYTGNGSTQTITNGINLSGKGGLVWFKSRSGAYNHALIDTVRGGGQVLSSNATSAQANYSPQGISAFNSNGFTFGTTTAELNNSSNTYASWTFRKAEKFFDVVTYTGNEVSGRTIAHNLASVPGCVIIKKTSGSNHWHVWHRSVTSPEANWWSNYLLLNTTNASNSWVGDGLLNEPTSTNLILGSGANVNENGATYVAYLFAHDAGGFGDSGSDNVISCGSYTGNGSATGPEITLGYEPQWVLIKRSSGGTAPWILVDTMRGMPVGGADAILYPDQANAEDNADTFIAPTATGFKIEGNLYYANASGSTYIYIAIRRGPMKTPEAGTEVFYPYAAAYPGNAVVTTGFPVDLQFQKDAGSTADIRAVDRLRGVSSTPTNPSAPFPFLVTSTTAADSNGTGTTLNWNNTGFTVGNTYSTDPKHWAVSFRRAPKFFDVVCFNGTGSQSIGIAHNLTVAPELIIEKPRNNIADWWVQHIPSNKVGNLQSNAAMTSLSGGGWVSPTSTLFYSAGFSTSWTEVAYLFATLSGVSKVGTYTGTGTTQQINCGFTGGARFVLIKRADSTGDWYVWDSARGIVAGNDPYLLLNSTAAEVTNTDYVDTYSAGFEISSTAPAAINANGGTFIYLAVA